MKARVKSTGDIVDVHRLCMSSQGDIWQKKSGKEYFAHELDFDVKEPPKPRYTPDYWTRLEHTYAGMAMQGLMSYVEQITPKKGRSFCDETVDISFKVAHALVERMKEER